MRKSWRPGQEGGLSIGQLAGERTNFKNTLIIYNKYFTGDKLFRQKCNHPRPM